MLPSHLFLWPDSVLYFGPLQHLEPRLHAAPALLVGLYRPFLIRLRNGPWQSCEAAVVPAGVSHEIDACGSVLGKLFVERDGSLHPALVQQFPPVAQHRFARIQQPRLREAFVHMYESGLDKQAMRHEVENLLPATTAPATDGANRLQQVLATIGSRCRENPSQEDLAQLVNLSPSRLLHLFKAETGVAYRRYRTWKRLLLAAGELHGSDNMTRSALDAGFADAAHFSHCYKACFGASPSWVFRSLQRFERGA
ncbi:AraC-type DNA-binding protein [Solimonas aquatica]|uniref:AraC-type DNA-binding protein n=1 Tax=Solimonas aquatica TaxID=489703 RepID=A0A1H9A2P4_9GAMM|nr:AraC family transcriptional regulator [Solimonas aquatica]SEP70773.1 AraC-type DNA-binding protein [Solimonas aquatica]